MRDEQIKELVSAYLDDELSVDERALVERHLADSVECRQFLDQLRQQRMALRSIPRRKLKSDFNQRVLRAIEQVRPAVSPGVVPAAASPQDRVAIRSRWKTWQGVAAAIGTVAALLILTFYLSQPNPGGVIPPKNQLVGEDKRPIGPALPDEVKPPEELVPKGAGPEEPLSPETLLALGEFGKLVQLVVVYDITLTPRAQKNKVLESAMAKAGIPISKGIVIDRKLEREILAARFVVNAKIAADLKGKLPEDEVEMLFVRGTGKQIDAVSRAYLTDGIRAEQPNNPEIIIKLDVVIAPQELNIFLQLNKATGLDLAEMKANPATLKAPSAFPLQFRNSMHSIALTRLEPKVALTALSSPDSTVTLTELRRSGDCDGELLLAQANTDSDAVVAQAPTAPPANVEIEGSVGWDEPSQAIFIIRRLKEEPNVDANK